ncbi:hypothetical protein GBAR_LOCUS14596, partial [Geodia barretti]
ASFSYAFLLSLEVFVPVKRRVPSSFLFLTHIEQSCWRPEMATGGGDQVWTWRKKPLPPSKAILRKAFENTSDFSLLCDHLSIPLDKRDVDSAIEYYMQSTHPMRDVLDERPTLPKLLRFPHTLGRTHQHHQKSQSELREVGDSVTGGQRWVHHANDRVSMSTGCR